MLQLLKVKKYLKLKFQLEKGVDEGSLGKWAQDIVFTDKEFRKQTLPQITKVMANKKIP
jgi:hypothetical protein